jgi:ERCC4-type nuclease
MILIDNRPGSVELSSLFPVGSKVESTRMEYGDFAFVGNGPEGPTFIGIERKTIRDLIQSMENGRLSGHQLIGLKETYSWVYLIVEGVWRSNPATGILEEKQGVAWAPYGFGTRRYMGREIMCYLNTLTVKTGVIVHKTFNRSETVQFILALHSWWERRWELHVSHLSQNKSARGQNGEVHLVPPTMLRRVAAELPGVGWGKSKDVEKHFGTVYAMTNAEVKEWMQIPGIGKTIAEKVVKEIRGEK